MNRAIESVFAEYQRELLKEFDVFGLDGSYETGTFSEERLLDRLDYYGASGIENVISRMQILTDNGGQAFRQQVYEYMTDKYKLEAFEGIIGDSSGWEEQEEQIADIEDYESKLENQLAGLLEENQTSLPEENNPLPNIELLKSKPLLELVMPEGMELSESRMELGQAASHRERQMGYGTFEDVAEESAANTLIFGEYLLEHFETAVSEVAMDGLAYELEYVIAGMESDKENLNKAIKKLLIMRSVSNYSYLLGDTAKRMEAEALAASLCAAVMVPAITEAVAQALLLAWAFGESVVDIRSLLEGKKVSLVKTTESWQLGLSSLLTLGTSQDQISGKDMETGLSYKEYLRILLFLEEKVSGKETITMRALDIVEQRLRKKEGLTWFRIDACVSKMEVKSTCRLRRGITYQFSTYFGYQ